MRRSLWAAVLMTLVMIAVGIISASAAPPAQTGDGAATATARALNLATLTTRPTPTPVVYAIRTGQTRVLKITVDSNGISAIGVDSTGLIYVGNGTDRVYVLGPDLETVRTFGAIQPYAITVTKRNEVLVSQRNQVMISAYDPEGKYLREFWSYPNAQLETMAAAPDGTVYVLWQTLYTPRVANLTRLDAQGNVIYSREFGRARDGVGAVHSVSAAPDGKRISITFSGFEQTVTDTISILRDYSVEGDPIFNDATLIFDSPLYAPTLALRLADNSLVLFTDNAVGWWTSDRKPRIILGGYVLRAGSLQQFSKARRGGMALRPDGYSAAYAEVNIDGELLVGIVSFEDYSGRSPTPTPAN